MKRKYATHPAIWFLAVIVIGTMMVLGGFVWVAKNPIRVMELAFLPGHSIDDDSSLAALDYSNTENWAARPDALSTAADLPEGIKVEPLPAADVFYIHPTTAFRKDRWNAPLDDTDARERIDAFALRHQASAFANAGRLFAPRYRQAVFGAFFDSGHDGIEAVRRATHDVLEAFDYYIAHENNGRPFHIVGHSQGAIHGLRLLEHRIAGTALEERLIAAYLVGWPIGERENLAPIGFSACRTATDTGCVISWQSFGKDSDPSYYFEARRERPNLYQDAADIALCTNPISWEYGGSAQAKDHLGAVPVIQGPGPVPAPIAKLSGAHCGEDGLLYLNQPLGEHWYEHAFAGGNLHPLDINLFWGDVHANARVRSLAYIRGHSTDPASVRTR